jgi:hypothetical protein
MKTTASTLVFVLMLAVSVCAQSRIYVSAGTSISLGGNISTVFASSPAQLYADVEWQKKMAGSISFVTALSTFGVAYSNDETAFGSQSVFKATYVAVPLMLRWNFGNKNTMYLDAGLQPQYLAKAHLQETLDKFGAARNAEGDITAYSNRLYVAAKFQFSVAINRLMLSMFIISPFSGQQSVSGLADHWKLNQQQSTYLLSNGYSDYYLFGFKAGVRIK